MTQENQSDIFRVSASDMAKCVAAPAGEVLIRYNMLHFIGIEVLACGIVILNAALIVALVLSPLPIKNKIVGAGANVVILYIFATVANVFGREAVIRDDFLVLTRFRLVKTIMPLKNLRSLVIRKQKTKMVIFDFEFDDKTSWHVCSSTARARSFAQALRTYAQ
jgi:hypothetical protein